MKEEFLHYIWKTKQFAPADLKTTQGQEIEIVFPGDHNFNSGPDFFNAQIKIEDMLWTGNVEIHIKASDWMKHKHQNDDTYNNVILHVVYECDCELKTHNDEALTTLVMRERIDMKLYENYLRLLKSKTTIVCANSINEIPSIIITSWLSRVLAERLERKISELKFELEQNGKDWEETFYRQLAKQFGMKINAEPFSWLAAAVPYKMISRQRDNLFQMEALLFGQAGLLPEKPEDEYSFTLISEYNFLQIKYHIQPMPSHWWRFMRLRPNNFPTIRIAQLAGLFFCQPQLFRSCMEANEISELKKLLDVSASNYWTEHYSFGKVSKSCEKNIGTQAMDTILINTIAPFKFLYGRMTANEHLVQDAISLLERIGPEKNKIIREWGCIKVQPTSAAESQALLELKKNYCDKKKCLSCEIGNYLLG
ncbi:MAG: DUF2851 family protein [Bacteroidetes bacterium]|jgi:hypothetical protein|nr:DUF2851 family protein [Bacteroidota bacterium]